MNHLLIRCILGGAVAAGAFSACGAAAYEVEEQGDVRAWVIGSAEGAGEALTTGTVRWLVGDRCWVLEAAPDEPATDPAPTRRAIVWPKGTTISSTSPPTLGAGGKSLTDGVQLNASGAGMDAAPVGLDIPAACRPAGVFVINRLLD